MTNTMHIDNENNKNNNNKNNNMNMNKNTATTSKIVDPKVGALNVTFDRNLGQWPNFLAHMSNLNFAQLPYYHIQQQQHQQQHQLQIQHKYQQHNQQQQRNFFNSNYQYQCAMRMSTMLIRKQQQQQELLRSHLHSQQHQQHQHVYNQQQQRQQQQREHQQTQQKRKQKQKPKQLLKPQQQQQQKHKQLKNIAAVVSTVASVKIVTPTKTTKPNENTKTNEIIKATEAAASSSSTTTTNETITTTTDEPTTKSNDTMQRNGSKASHNLKSHKDSQHHHHNHQHHQHHHHHSQQQQEQHHQQQNKNDSSDSGVSSAGHHQAHGAKQRKTRGAHKRQQQTHMAGHQKRSSQTTNSGYSVDEWLGRDVVYCYERRFMTSSDEDNLISHHNAKHRNSTSSDTAGSDDTISSSSNDDISAISASAAKPGKKLSNKTRQTQTRRQQKRKQQNTKHNNNGKKDESNKENNGSKPEDDMFYMGGVLITSPYMLPNSHPSNYYSEISSIMRHGNNIDANLRMQCTRTAAIRADNHHWSSLSSASYALDLQAYNSLNYAPVVSSSSSTSSSPIGSPIVSKRHNTTAKKEAASQSISTDFGPVDTLNMSEHELAAHLSRYLMDPNYFRDYGYPVESRAFNGMVEIFKPGFAHTDQNWCSSGSDQYSDSGRNSGNSSPASMESDSSEVEEITEETMAQSYHKLEQYNRSIEKECARCKRIFHVTEDGEYLNQESCVYHWGKIVRKYSRDCGPWAGYTCCQRTAESTGCSRHSNHVWSGAVRGLNGPYTDYVNTSDTPHKMPGHFDKVFAMDCEMSYTGRGLEVTKITVIGHDGAVAYEHFVRPEVEIVDYNTRFSGVTEQDLNGESHITVKSLTEVQSDLLALFDTNTILIGHALENDFRGLRIMHKAVIDTSITFPHASGFPYKLGLKSLAKRFLNRDIQTKDKGHCSYEDSRTCLDLMLHKLRSDLNDEFNCLQH